MKAPDVMDDKAKLNKLLGNFSNIHSNNRQHREALEFYWKVLAIKQRLRSSQQLAITFNVIGEELKTLGDLNGALEQISQAVSLAATLPNKLCEYINYQAEIYSFLEDNTQAQTLCAQAKEIVKACGRKSVVEACEGIETWISQSEKI